MAPTWEQTFTGVVAGVIESGAMQRATSSQMWAKLRPAIAEAGLPTGQAGLAIVRQLWSAAATRRKGYEAFARAKPTDLFTTRMAAPDMSMRSQVLRDMVPQYRVRFDLSGRNADGELETRTVSMMDIWRPGTTVGDVLDAVAEAAEALSRKYKLEYVGHANLRPVQF